jgi:uncharacterized integral membrane protein
LLCVAAGIVFGALNPHSVDIDFYWFSFSASLGSAFLLSALVGALLGGFAITLGIVWPLRRRLRRATRQVGKPPDSSTSTDLVVASAPNTDRL